MNHMSPGTAHVHLSNRTALSPGTDAHRTRHLSPGTAKLSPGTATTEPRA